MQTSLQEKCNLFIENKNTISNVFKMDGAGLIIAAAYLFTGAGKTANEDELKNAKEILTKNTGVLSEFRGNVRIPLICKMVLSGNEEQYFSNVMEIYIALNNSKYFGNEYKILAAMTICDKIGGGNAESYIEKTNELYDRMRENHKWLTSNEDIPFAAILAVSGIDTDKLVDDMEKCFALLKKSFNGNILQSLSHVLSLNEKPAEEKCETLMNIFNLLKQKKHKYSTNYHLASLGLATMLEIPAEQIADEIIEVDDFLKTQKGFGDFVLGSETRRMYASQLVTDAHSPSDKNLDGVALGTMLAYTVAMEIIMIVIMASCMASSAANH